jgi:hypothetical protein
MVSTDLADSCLPSVVGAHTSAASRLMISFKQEGLCGSKACKGVATNRERKRVINKSALTIIIFSQEIEQFCAPHTNILAPENVLSHTKEYPASINSYSFGVV